MTVAAELIAGAIIIKYWFPNSNSSLWAMLFLAATLAAAGAILGRKIGSIFKL